MKTNLSAILQVNHQSLDLKMKAVVLAGGNGTRMKTDIPKILIPIHGVPMIQRLVQILHRCHSIKESIIICQNQMIQTLENLLPNSILVVQPAPLGTGHALFCAVDQFQEADIILVLPADLPCMDEATLQVIIDYYQQVICDILIIGMKVQNPQGYGRIIMNDNQVQKIVEEKETTDDEKQIDVINTSVYVMKTDKIKPILKCLRPNNHANEYYLTDIIEKLRCIDPRSNIQTLIFPETNALHGANDMQTLVQLLKE